MFDDITRVLIVRTGEGDEETTENERRRRDGCAKDKLMSASPSGLTLQNVTD